MDHAQHQVSIGTDTLIWGIKTDLGVGVPAGNKKLILRAVGDLLHDLEEVI